jgi:hypothetical protein
VLLFCLTSVLVFSALLEGALRFGIIENAQYDRRLTQKKGETQTANSRSPSLYREAYSPSLWLGISRALDVSVLNAAISGTGPFEYLAEMKAVGTSFKPHVVLLSYYVGNDLTNVQNHPQFNPTKTGLGH